MTNVGMFDDAIKFKKQATEIKKLKKLIYILQKEVAALKQQLHTDNEKSQKRIEELMEINKEHQQVNGKQHSELEIERKNHTLSVEALELEVRIKDRELGRQMRKLSKK